jgi:hypothetical protein
VQRKRVARSDAPLIRDPGLVQNSTGVPRLQRNIPLPLHVAQRAGHGG